MRSRADPVQEEGGVRMQGGTTPASFNHQCPYQQYGANKIFCEETTTNYQRNLAGCCGTSDSRNFAPCNSFLRRCVKCLSEGRGSKSNKVEDVARGLCEEHAGVGQNSAVPKPRQITPPQVVRRAVSVLNSTPRPFKAPMVDKPRLPASATVVDTRLEMMRNIGSKMADVARRPPVVPIPPPSPPRPLARVERIVPPVLSGVDKLEAKFVESKVPKPQVEFDVDACAKRVSSLSARNREILGDVSQGRKPVGLTDDSLKSILSAIATSLGIPKTNRYEGFDRRGAVLRVWARHKELLVSKQGNNRGLLESVPTRDQERELMRVFQSKNPHQRDLILKYARSI